MNLIEFLHQLDYLSAATGENGSINSQLLSVSGMATPVLKNTNLISSSLLTFSVNNARLAGTGITDDLLTITCSATGDKELLGSISDILAAITSSPATVSSILFGGIYPYQNKVFASINLFCTAVGSTEVQIPAACSDSINIMSGNISSIDIWAHDIITEPVLEISSLVNATVDRSALEVRAIAIAALTVSGIPTNPLFTHVITASPVIAGVTLNSRSLGIIL